MPTGRAYSFIVTALILYFFANQTQVGWLYIMSALILGVVVTAWFLNRGALRRLDVSRSVGDEPGAAFHEGDDIAVALTLKNHRRTPAPHVRALEQCPLAAPGSPQRSMKLFTTAIRRRSEVTFHYDVTVDRRGLHEYPPITLTSRAPFGFFQREADIDLRTRALAYPEVRKLKRLRLLDDQRATDMVRPRAGVGSEVIGVRPYRSGDSPRHIHWRSVARTGQLVSKEFAEEGRPGVTIVLDTLRDPRPWLDSKHTPFEYAVKVAASIGEYAQRRGFPLEVVADPDALPAPYGALSWDALMQYLARVQPTGTRPLTEVVEHAPLQTRIAAIIATPDDSLIESLTVLRMRGFQVMAVVCDPASFPASGVPADALVAGLRANGVETFTVRYGEDWVETLSQDEHMIEGI